MIHAVGSPSKFYMILSTANIKYVTLWDYSVVGMWRGKGGGRELPSVKYPNICIAQSLSTPLLPPPFQFFREQTSYIHTQIYSKLCHFFSFYTVGNIIHFFIPTLQETLFKFDVPTQKEMSSSFSLLHWKKWVQVFRTYTERNEFKFFVPTFLYSKKKYSRSLLLHW